MNLIALDTETTGIDFWHGARPFLVNISYEDGNVDSWEWEVNPKTRKVNVLKEDKREIRRAIKDQTIVMHNSKFDVRALEFIGVKIDWRNVEDSLIAAHLVNSSIPHDLTSSVLKYLSVDVQPYEEAIKVETRKARAEAKKLGWRIAQKGLPEMPSAKGEVWKYDLWIPRQLAELQGLSSDHPWHNVVHDYAYTDPVVTLALFKALKKIIDEKELDKIYEARMEMVPVIYDMENVGVTYNQKRMDKLTSEYIEEAEKAEKVCKSIAKTYDYELTVPKGGNNKSLTTFIFDKLNLPVIATSKKTGAPSLNRQVIDEYLSTLPPRSKQLRFISNLSEKRIRSTAVSYMDGYKKFALGENEWKTLHPSVNLTGTITLRNSSNNPNEQNISKKDGFNLRYGFGPAPGREWWSLDYDNLELRIPAYECQEPAMLKLFEKPGEGPFFGSYHLLIFSILYPDEFKLYGTDVKSKYKSTLYQWTKNGNFAELYGAVDTGDGRSTADRAFHYSGAQAIVASKLKQKAELNQYWIDYANSKGYVETVPDKTVDPEHGYPIYCSRTSWGKISPTVPLNYHVQGTACWVKLRAMIKCAQQLEEWNKGLEPGEGYYLTMEVHDEIDFDFPYKPNKGNLPKIRKIQKLMESCGDDIGIPLTVGIDYHKDNWSQAQ